MYTATRVVMNGDVPLAVSEAGDPSRTPLFLLHGITSSAASWQAVVPALAEHFFVQAIDLRGHGRSGHPRHGYREGDYVADLQVAIADAEVEHPLIVGHSLGARVTFNWAARYPDVSAALVLEDPPLTTPEWVDGNFRQMLDLKSRPLPEIEAWVRQQNPDADADGVRQRAANLDALAVGIYEDALAEMDERPGEDRLAALAEIRSPVLVVRGDPASGGITPLVDVARLRTHVPDLADEYIPAGPHNLHRERTDAFLAAVVPFLLAHDPARMTRAPTT